jgi:hypothetical protein
MELAIILIYSVTVVIMAVVYYWVFNKFFMRGYPLYEVVLCAALTSFTWPIFELASLAYVIQQKLKRNYISHKFPVQLLWWVLVISIIVGGICAVMVNYIIGMMIIASTSIAVFALILIHLHENHSD